MNDSLQGEKTRLLELLGEETELFERIYELTEKQAKLLAADDDDINAFNDSLDSRQELIERIKGLHQESDPLMQSCMSMTNNAAGDNAKAIEKAIAQRQAVIEKCVVLNDKNTAAAKEKSGDFTKRIGKLSLSRKSIKVYTPDIPNNPELFDKKT